MTYANVSGITDILKQDLALEFCRKQYKDISISTEIHICHDQIHQIRSNWCGPIFFFPGNSHTEGLLVLIQPGLEGLTEVDTDLKGIFVSFKVTRSNNGVLCVCILSRHSTREQLVRERFFEGVQNYTENKCKGNENKILLGEFN